MKTVLTFKLPRGADAVKKSRDSLTNPSSTQDSNNLGFSKILSNNRGLLL